MEESETRRMEEEVRKAVEQAKELQDSAASFIARASGDEQSLRQRAAALDSTIRRLRSSIDSLLAHKLLDPKHADKASGPTTPYSAFSCLFGIVIFHVYMQGNTIEFAL